MSTSMAAESFLLHTMQKIMETLISPETPPVTRVREQLQKLLEGIKAEIERVEQDKDQNIEVELWLSTVEDVLDDLEDRLDELSTEDLRWKKGTSLSKLCKFFSSVSNRKPDIDIAQLSNALERLLNKVRTATSMERDPEEEVSRGKQEKEQVIIERKVEKELVIRYLFDKVPSISEETRQKLVIGRIAGGSRISRIVGMKGIGKTTLAKQVYNDERVKRHFNKRFWVSVSGTTCYSHRLKLMEGDSIEPLMELEARECKDMTKLLGSKMNGKCLLVVDNPTHLVRDLWVNLPLDCKALLTSRSSHVMSGKMMEDLAHVVNLTELSEKEAWSLLINVRPISFGHGQPIPWDDTKVKSTAKEIVEKCKGIPLVIKYAASSLGSKHSVEDWEEFKNVDLEKINSLISFSANVEATVQAKDWDHLHPLPPHLKHCFAYSGLLSADHEYDEQTLINLWMAQGFIIKPSSDGSQSLEDVGRNYFENLRRMFHVSSDDTLRDKGHNTPRRFKLIRYHRIAVYAAQGKIVFMDPYGDTVHERVRHVTLNFNLDSSWQVPKTLLQAGRLKTLLLSPQPLFPHEKKLSAMTCDAIFSNFKRLRALDLHDLGMKIVPDSLGKLKHLRYLDLSENRFETLPKCMTNLVNLQTLKLSNCPKLKELPKGIQNLDKLRHLYVDGCFSLKHMPPKMGQLTSLETLSTFVVSKDSVPRGIGGLEELSHLINLRGSLEIVHLERLRRNTLRTESSAILREKTNLQCLTLRWNQDEEDNDGDHYDNEKADENLSSKYLEPHRDLQKLIIMGFNGKSLPSWLSNFSNLSQLTLYNCSKCKFLPPWKWNDLQMLEILELERLEDLEFVADFEEHSSTASVDPIILPRLKRVTFWDCPNLVSWWKIGNADPGKLPYNRTIEKVEIQYCPKLTPIPFYPKELVLVCLSLYQLEQMLMLKNLEPASSSSIGEQLKSLTIGKIDELETLPGELLRNFTNLRRLRIYNCHKLGSLSIGIQHLSSLKTLIIENCSQLDLVHGDDRDKVWEGLEELGFVTLRGIPKLTSLPQGLKKEKYLKLINCPNLKSIPEMRFPFRVEIED